MICRASPENDVNSDESLGQLSQEVETPWDTPGGWTWSHRLLYAITDTIKLNLVLIGGFVSGHAYSRESQ